jgi:hypothetical protein
MTYEWSTTLIPSQVLARAKAFFAERVPLRAAYAEKEGDNFLVLRGQGGEEVVFSAVVAEGGTAIRASTLLFDQEVSRFFTTLPTRATAAAG